MRICISQLNPIIGAIDLNTSRIIQEIKRAKKEHVELIIFPELAISGYFPDDLLRQSGFIESVQKSLEGIIAAAEEIAVIVGLPRYAPQVHDKPLYNSAAVIIDGRLLGYQDKALLPTYDVFDERRFFTPALDEKIWDIHGKRIGITICEDIWPFDGASRQERYPHDPLCHFIDDAIHLDFLINISASPYSVEKIAMREEVAKACALRANCPVILCNQIGGQDGLLFDGTSIVVSPSGKVLARAKSFSEEHLVFTLNGSTEGSPVAEKMDEQEELFSALVMGLKDYFTKQGFTKACVGLSGGIDSALVASIAVQALGKENVLGVLLPSRFTSSRSTEDALHVAENLDINTIEIPIEKPFQTYLDTLHPLLLEKPFDVTEENLQARIRGTLLMAISNLQGRLLLNTSNKSELAVGYTTLYGDSCGAVAVIGDLLKGQVIQLSKWIMNTYGWIPPEVISREPTAELRLDQKDSDTLPEYPVLDSILDAYIVNGKSIEEIADKLQCPQEIVSGIIRKIHQNEYKRRQCPFALRVSEKAFSYGRQVPIVHSFIGG